MFDGLEQKWKTATCILAWKSIGQTWSASQTRLKAFFYTSVGNKHCSVFLPGIPGVEGEPCLALYLQSRRGCRAGKREIMLQENLLYLAQANIRRTRGRGLWADTTYGFEDSQEDSGICYSSAEARPDVDWLEDCVDIFQSSCFSLSYIHLLETN